MWKFRAHFQFDSGHSQSGILVGTTSPWVEHELLLIRKASSPLRATCCSHKIWICRDISVMFNCRITQPSLFIQSGSTAAWQRRGRNLCLQQIESFLGFPGIGNGPEVWQHLCFLGLRSYPTEEYEGENSICKNLSSFTIAPLSHSPFLHGISFFSRVPGQPHAFYKTALPGSMWMRPLTPAYQTFLV